MKKCLKPMNYAGLILVSALTFTACSDEETAVEETLDSQEVISVAELQYSDESEQMADEIAEIAEDVYVSDEFLSTGKSAYFSDYLPDCVTITTVVTDTTREKTIDFGEGCELRNGNILSGSINLSYEKDMEAASKSLSLSLENFSFNGVAIEGSASVLRVRSNENGNPQGTSTSNYTATWPDGEVASFSGTRTREWIEGFGTGFWGDNVFLVTGNGTYTGRAGVVYTKEVISPLRREMACRFIVSGVLEISRSGTTASLDFGDGSCDARGILTYPDETSEEVFLRRFFRN
ncbi:MAG: hypothetical protein AAGF96_05785 [Bacteroidota bacterium]